MLREATGLTAALILIGCAAPLETSSVQPATALSTEAESVEIAKVNAEGIAALEAGMRGFVDDGHVIGIETKMIVGGETVSHVLYGVRDVETGAPIEDDTIYRIYSMTKPITGVALMMLYEEGAFSLDDPVTKYVPEFEGLKVLGGVDEDGAPILVDAERAPTMREVMSHTAGFAYGLGGEDAANAAFREQQILASPDLETFIAKTAEVPLLSQPGSYWAYSASVDVQGYIVQKLSGQRFGEYLDERIFSPLGMIDTGFYVPEGDLDRFSDVIGNDPETGELVPVNSPRVAFLKETLRMESGGGGLVSTMDDYERFTLMVANGGELDGVRILQPETVELMRTNVLPEGMSIFSDGALVSEATRGHGFGLDFGVIVDPSATGTPAAKGTYYWGGAAGTWFWIDPVNDMIFIGMIQRFGGGDEANFRGESTRLAYGALQD